MSDDVVYATNAAGLATVTLPAPVKASERISVKFDGGQLGGRVLVEPVGVYLQLHGELRRFVVVHHDDIDHLAWELVEEDR